MELTPAFEILHDSSGHVTVNFKEEVPSTVLEEIVEDLDMSVFLNTAMSPHLFRVLESLVSRLLREMVEEDRLVFAGPRSNVQWVHFNTLCSQKGCFSKAAVLCPHCSKEMDKALETVEFAEVIEGDIWSGCGQHQCPRHNSSPPFLGFE